MSTQKNIDGVWKPAKRVPYHPTLTEKLKCFFGFHNFFDSELYENTKVCFHCGKKKIMTHWKD